MPRKVRVPADREANRQSQQQARQRQREYVASLEKKVTEYERRGVQATIEVQRAARAVAATNEKLLALLKVHDVQDAEIEAFLREPTPEQGAKATAPPIASPSCGAYVQISNSSQSAEMPTSLPPLKMHPLSALLSTENLPKAATPRLPSQLPPGRVPGCNIPTANIGDSEQTNSCGKNAPGIPCSPDAGAQPVTSKYQEIPGQETSCDTAASIISEIHGLNDLSEARTVLGCTTPGSCSVRNIRLFELMDRTG
ncbi:uncharacterized protein PG998_011412 [Apiospora kogelbergensis]|uniref:uncharacterized protein n=1 Tax=Apiospora kogelbergensis TaxID=1337665 RepID=UPI00312F7E9D